MIITDELLPCPFCGNSAEIYNAVERRPDPDGTLQGHWVVDCSICDANIEFCRSPEDSKDKWNTRAERSRGVGGVDLSHGMNCWGNTPGRQNDCTCGLKWRIQLQTESTMHQAWRKRAEEAEAAIAALPSPAPLSAGDREKLLAKVGCAVTYVEDAEAALSAIEKHYTLARKL